MVVIPHTGLALQIQLLLKKGGVGREKDAQVARQPKPHCFLLLRTAS